MVMHGQPGMMHGHPGGHPGHHGHGKHGFKKFKKFKKGKHSWLKGADIKDGQASAMIWANDANSHICDTVLTDGVDGIEGDELYPEYYRKSIPVIELMVAKAGYRLAAWLDLLATGKTNLRLSRDEPLISRSIALDGEIHSPSFPGQPGWPKGFVSEARIKRLAFGKDCNCGHKH